MLRTKPKPQNLALTISRRRLRKCSSQDIAATSAVVDIAAIVVSRMIWEFALKLRRQFIGVEIEKERFEIAQANIARIVREISTT